MLSVLATSGGSAAISAFRAATFYEALWPPATASSKQRLEFDGIPGALPADEFRSSPLKNGTIVAAAIRLHGALCPGCLPNPADFQARSLTGNREQPFD
jgi:hypothetical protein